MHENFYETRTTYLYPSPFHIKKSVNGIQTLHLKTFSFPFFISLFIPSHVVCSVLYVLWNMNYTNNHVRSCCQGPILFKPRFGQCPFYAVVTYTMFLWKFLGSIIHSYGFDAFAIFLYRSHQVYNFLLQSSITSP